MSAFSTSFLVTGLEEPEGQTCENGSVEWEWEGALTDGAHCSDGDEPDEPDVPNEDLDSPREE